MFCRQYQLNNKNQYFGLILESIVSVSGICKNLISVELDLKGRQSNRLTVLYFACIEGKTGTKSLRSDTNID